MKKAAKILALVLVVIVIAIGALIGYVTTALPNVGLASDIKIEYTPENIARGSIWHIMSPHVWIVTPHATGPNFQARWLREHWVRAENSSTGNSASPELIIPATSHLPASSAIPMANCSASSLLALQKKAVPCFRSCPILTTVKWTLKTLNASSHLSGRWILFRTTYRPPFPISR
jgi:hypothetical protein